MTTPNGKPMGGVILGGTAFRIELDKDYTHNLKELAMFFNVSPTSYATYLLNRALELAVLEVQTGYALVNCMLRGFVQ